MNLLVTYQQQKDLKDELKARVVTRVTFPDLVFAQDFSGRRGPTAPSVERISGPAESVRDFVAHRLQTDSCTRCYEHMLWKIEEVHASEDGSHLEIKMTRSNYAGD